MDATTRNVMVNDRHHFLSIVDKMVRVQGVPQSKAYAGALTYVSSTLHEALALVKAEGASLPPSHPLAEARGKWFQEINDIQALWSDELTSLHQRSDFTSKHGHGHMVCVFGKVKAGKSSLGNYVAYGVPTPTKEDIAGAAPKPEFFYETGGGHNEAMSSDKMADQKCFGIGVGETTSSIQGFTLPGFTWVDTPGVHSVNVENGKLAARYVDACDLVVYALNSSSPERRSDIEEIVGLLRRGKPLLLVITASDVLEEDEGPDGELIQATVMKSESDRRGQCDRVRALVEAAVGESDIETCDFTVVSLSARFASEGLVSEAERWSQSGMNDFFSTLVDRFKSQGIASRSKAALNDLKVCLNKTSDSLKAYQAPCDVFEKEIHQKEKEVRIGCQATETAMNREIKPIVEQLVTMYVSERQNEALKTALRETFLKYLRSNGERLFSQFGYEKGMTALRIRLKGPRGIPAFREVTATTQHESNLGSNIAAVAGTAIGAFLGTGAFSLITAPIGGFIGKAVGTLLDGPREVTVSHGFNTAEVCDGAYRQIEEWSKAARTQMQQSLDKWITGRNWTSHSFFLDEIRGLEASVKNSELSIQKELANGNS